MLWTGPPLFQTRDQRGSRIADFVGKGPEDTRGRFSGSQSVTVAQLCGETAAPDDVPVNGLGCVPGTLSLDRARGVSPAFHVSQSAILLSCL